MRDEATKAGFYEPAHFPDHQYPAIQILTVEELLGTFRKAKPIIKAGGEQQASIFDQDSSLGME